MNKIIVLALAALLTSLSAVATTSRAYGIRVYSKSTGSSQALVSFPVDKPSDVRTELDLSDYKIVAAAGYNGDYYMFHASDGILTDKIVHIDLNRMRIDRTMEIDYKFNLAGNIIFTDAAWDKLTGRIYAAGFNIAAGEITEDEISAPFGIYIIDPATGETTTLVEQDERALSSLLVDPRGFIYAVDNLSYIWNIDYNDGSFGFPTLQTGFPPTGLQSMAYDFGKSVMYYAAYTEDSFGNGESHFLELALNADYEMISKEIGSVGSSAEIIGLYIDSDPAPDNAPANIRDLAVNAGARGQLSASLSWTNPAATIAGNNLTSVDLAIYRDDAEVATIKGAAAGQKMDWTDNNVAKGMHVYAVAPSTGEFRGNRQLSDSIWIGTDTPGAVAAVKASKAENSNAISLSWSAPATGEHGGWFDASQLRYTVVRHPDNKTVLNSSTSTSLTDTDITDLHGYYYEITAATASGNGVTVASTPVVSGAPLAVPYRTDFNIPDHVNQWTVVNADNDGYTWYPHYTGWAGTFDVFFRYNPENALNPESTTNDWLISPPVALETGKYYVAKYDVRLLGSMFPANTTLAMGEGATPAAMSRELEKIDGHINDIEWITHSLTFTVDRNGTYNFGYNIRNAVPVQFYNFKVEEIYPTDIATIEVSGNDLAYTGAEHIYEVVVANNGFNAIGRYEVQLTDADGNVLASTSVNEPLRAQSTTTVSVRWTPAVEGVIDLYARAKVDGDADRTNDSCSPLKVNVLDNVTAVDVTSGMMPTGYAPIYGSFKNSAVQTIYTPVHLGHMSASSKVKALIYYIYPFAGTQGNTIDLDVALANVDKADFGDNAMVPESEFKYVFNRRITLDPEQRTLTIAFDEPFDYNGGNLCIFTRHHSESQANTMFYALYSSDDMDTHTCLYRGDTPFDFTQDPIGSYRDLPNVTLLVSGNSALDRIEGDGADVDIVYSRDLSVLNIIGDHESCEIYSMTGTLICRLDSDSEISLSGLPKGPAIVKVTTANGIATAKIII